MLISIPAGQFAFEYEAVAIVLLPQLGFLHEGGGHVLPGRPHSQGFDGSKPGRSFPNNLIYIYIELDNLFVLISKIIFT